MARRIALLAGALAFTGSGAYTLIYLTRWEWHRALIAGIFLVATELALATAAIMHKLRSIERQVGEIARHQSNGAASADVLQRIEESAPVRKPFAWLSSQRGEMNVFLPFLLGAGMLASAVAWLVEGIAKSTARPVLEQRLALRLAPISLPAGGLLGDLPFVPVEQVTQRIGAKLRKVAAVIAAAGVLFLVIDALADATQGRPDAPGSAPAMTTIELHLAGNRAVADPTQAANTLWAACSQVLHRTFPAPQIVGTAPDHAVIMLNTPLGEHARRRVVGCLEDALVDKIQAGVVAVTPAL